MKKKNLLNSPRLRALRKKKRRAFAIKIVIALFALALLTTGSVFFFKIEGLNIDEIAVSGNKIADASIIEEIARKNMEGKYFWLFPKTNVLFYPKEKIRIEIAQNFKRLTDIELDIKEGTKLEISVAERVSVYTWCGESPASNEKCYFMDKDGFIFEEAPFFSEEVYFRFYGMVSEEPDPIGKYFARNVFEKLIYLKKILEEMEVRPVALYMENAEDGQVILSSMNLRRDNPEIFFKINDNVNDITDNLQTALGTDPLKTDFKKKYANLEYIDLRFGNKVYYRFE